MKPTLIALMLALTTSPTFAQTQGGNGGFAYKKAVTLLEAAKNHAIILLQNREFTNEDLAKASLPPLDVPRMIQAIKNLKMEYTKEEFATDPSGKKGFPKMFTYHQSNAVEPYDYIVALKPYFIAYMSNAYTRKDYGRTQFTASAHGPSQVMEKFLANSILREVSLLLIHEAAHVSGYQSEVHAETLENEFFSGY